jgi:hypothetical protein
MPAVYVVVNSSIKFLVINIWLYTRELQSALCATVFLAVKHTLKDI